MLTVFRFRRAVWRRRIRVKAIRRGLLGGSKPWLAIFALGLLGRGMTKITKRGVFPVVFSEPLKPGERLLITHIVPTRRGRRGKGAS